MSNIFVFVVGGPGSGKGTQCVKILEDFKDWEHLSTGDLLRKEKESGSELGQRCDAVMKEGKMVSLEIILELISKAVKQSKYKKFLLDGYPREVEQIKAFQDKIGDFSLALYYEVPDDILIERLNARSSMSNRSDDNPETIAKRIDAFHKSTLPVIDKLKELNKLTKIDARSTSDEIFKTTKACIECLPYQFEDCVICNKENIAQ